MGAIIFFEKPGRNFITHECFVNLIFFYWASSEASDLKSCTATSELELIRGAIYTFSFRCYEIQTGKILPKNMWSKKVMRFFSTTVFWGNAANCSGEILVNMKKSG
jgi:hypothetical protein